MGDTEIESFLNYLVLQCYCSKSTQRTALNALIFLFVKFLQRDDIGELNFKASKRHPKILVVFTHEEAMIVISHLSGKYKLMTYLMYGTELRCYHLISRSVRRAFLCGRLFSDSNLFT